MVEAIKDAVDEDKVAAARNIKFAEFADYLEGKITFNELMELLLEGLDEVDEQGYYFGDFISKIDFKIKKGARTVGSINE